MRVYVAERYASFRNLLVDVLQQDGHEVTSAHDGSALVAMIVDAAPDVVLLELVLSGMTAIDVITAMRAAHVLAPVVIMTDAPATAEAAVAGLGSVRVLQKPFLLEALERTLAEVTTELAQR